MACPPAHVKNDPACAVGTIGVSYDDVDDRVILVIEELVPDDETGAIARLQVRILDFA